jgi:hypothetical protein
MKLASLEAILSVLRSADVRYLIVGGLAVAAHGHGRATFDLDLVVQLLPANAARALSALESLGYRPTAPVPAAHFTEAHHRESWIRDKNMVVFQMHSDKHPETRIDLFVSEPFDFDIEYDRAMIGDILPDLPARFVCLDTLLLMKEQAGRPKDLEDVRQLRLLSGARKE